MSTLSSEGLMNTHVEDTPSSSPLQMSVEEPSAAAVVGTASSSAEDGASSEEVTALTIDPAVTFEYI